MELTGTKLLKQFKDYGISHEASDERFQHTLDFQDFIGHSSQPELTQFYKDLDQNERKLFIWACSVCLSPDSLIEVLKSTTILIERERLYDQFEKDIEKRETGLFLKERAFDDCKKSIHKKIASLNSDIQDLKNRLEWQVQCTNTARTAKDRYLKRANEFELKACNFDNLKAAFSLLTV